MVAFELSPADVNCFYIIPYKVQVKSDILWSDECWQQHGVKCIHYLDEDHKCPIVPLQVLADQHLLV
jgi:hypothetical protein